MSNSATKTETVYDNPIVIQLIDKPECECHGFIFTNCINCKTVLSTTFQPTQTQLSLIQSQKSAVSNEREDLEDKVYELKQTIEDRQNSITKTVEGIQSLQHDMKVLNLKCEEEVVQVEAIQKSKETVKRELEELTQKLFEEAENMVQMEKTEQELVRQENDKLEHKLKTIKDELQISSTEVKLLKDQMKTKEDRPYAVDAYFRAQLEMMMANNLNVGHQIETVEDDAALMDFNDFMQMSSQTPLRKLHSLKYMKYSVREDVEPCLRFGPNPRLAAKKIVDAILVKTCFVEECPEGFVDEQCARQQEEEATATLWERFTHGSFFMGCQACGRRVKEEEREEVLKYRFRISYFDEWACVDRYCRDRLAAAIEFYSFIRHMRAGLYKHRSLHELYQQMSRLRLQMFLARMGALPYLLSSSHLDPQKITTAFHGEEIVLPSYLDSTSERLSSSTDSTITSISTIESIRTFSSH
ncbi:hypothetical protein CU098_009459 [Rhizopus stolonifer]|uniref:GDP/GTP exchange factor Sec2 N-terminal domain-containing protein n=1 Tax=Rhizopus stolonifer TaxID=4846 RepID=A0A367JNA3_RHIST|nr:hypothetical protein CU098_009459 [Rhizopus stolonifer]